MTRLYVLVEGQTEEEFVKATLKPHLAGWSIWVYPVIVETSRDARGRKRRGGGRWQHWHKDLRRLTSQQTGSDVRFTTMFDLYGLPDDFPGLPEHGTDADTVRRAEQLEAAMAEAVGDWRLIPYLQRHEFEALVLAGLDVLAGLLEDQEDVAGLTALRTAMAGMLPEEVNDGRLTAPSKRLESHIPGYRKTLHGPLVAGGAGLDALRSTCRRFDAWVSKLEALANPSQESTPPPVWAR
jgi:hypothetical protein